MAAFTSIPAELDPFLAWLKARTEAAWADYRTTPFEAFRESGVGGQSWRAGTTWRPGLTEPEIDAAERRWSLRFPADYRRFLGVLNAPDRGLYSVGWSDEPPYDMRQFEDEPSFYDWQRDDAALKSALEWPLEGLLFDVEQAGFWPRSWGERPPDGAIETRLRELIAAAPPLVPLTGHRYLLGEPLSAGNPVLSVYQSDIIVYASDLQGLLVVELADLIGLEFTDAQARATRNMQTERIAAIPFWGDLILGNGDDDQIG